MKVDTVLSTCVRIVEDYFLRIGDELETVRALLVGPFEGGPVDSRLASRSIEPQVRAFLDRSPVIGAGYVAAPGALSDHELYLAWWQGDDKHLLATSDAPATGDPLDYTRHAWFRTPARTGLPHVTGPYVDFVCTDEYVMTSTTPVLAHGRMVGVVGADTLLESLETLLLPTLRDARATLVNGASRVVVSSDPHHGTGALLDLSTCREVQPCRGLPLSVALH
ncbi:MAG: cache domain-containing protein [Nocardioidaceae bacterium]|nr:cache domain-containing protein [Nocardioidaceae bacterium]